MRLAALVAVLAMFVAALVALTVPGGAAAHGSGCHRWHTCPSDHHTYAWHGLWCTSYGSERLTADSKTVAYEGISYWCHGIKTSAVAAASVSSSPESSGGDSGESSGGCGLERWAVKTLQDRPSLLPVRTTTVRFLVTRPAPSSLPTTRLPFERHVYTVIAAVTLVRHEADSDLHLVLKAGTDHMIAESASPSCDSKATAPRRKQIAAARQKVRLCAEARVTGVAFFDFKHGQTGVAPNAIELHPILAFDCLSG